MAIRERIGGSYQVQRTLDCSRYESRWTISARSLCDAGFAPPVAGGNGTAEILFANPLREGDTGTRIPFLRFTKRRREVRKWWVRIVLEDAAEPSRTGFAANRKVGVE